MKFNEKFKQIIKKNIWKFIRKTNYKGNGLINNKETEFIEILGENEEIKNNIDFSQNNHNNQILKKINENPEENKDNNINENIEYSKQKPKKREKKPKYEENNLLIKSEKTIIPMKKRKLRDRNMKSNNNININNNNRNIYDNINDNINNNINNNNNNNDKIPINFIENQEPYRKILDFAAFNASFKINERIDFRIKSKEKDTSSHWINKKRPKIHYIDSEIVYSNIENIGIQAEIVKIDNVASLQESNFDHYFTSIKANILNYGRFKEEEIPTFFLTKAEKQEEIEEFFSEELLKIKDDFRFKSLFDFINQTDLLL